MKEFQNDWLWLYKHKYKHVFLHLIFQISISNYITEKVIGLRITSFIPFFKHSSIYFLELKAVQPIIGISGMHFY